MINWNMTEYETGYSKNYFDKYPKSNKKVYAICDNCNIGRWITFQQYRNLCRLCTLRNRKGIKFSEEHKMKLSKVHKGKIHSKETKEKMSNSSHQLLGKDHFNYGKHYSEEHKIKISCTQQGINKEDFVGFLTEQKYCHKFNFKLKEQIRDKYNRKCFICGKVESENGKRLSVHHVDMSKSQGCNGEQWKLVPVCQSCHGSLHSALWQIRIEYLLKNNGEYL